MDIAHFIDKLATESVERSFNHYARVGAIQNGYDTTADNAIRRKNLELYLRELATRRPKILLVGEAPGYQGNRNTGIPFLSEDVMMRGVEELELFGAHNGFQKGDEFPDKVWKEPSSTIVWGELRRLWGGSEKGDVPLIWSAYPFHPHKDVDYFSNRAPTQAELVVGMRYLHDMLEMFSDSLEVCVAVGNSAEKALGAMDVNGLHVCKIRHPSHGGKADFSRGLAAVFENRVLKTGTKIEGGS